MKRNLLQPNLILLACLCSATLTFGQSLNGKISGSDDTPISYANVLLYQSTDSILVKANLSEEDGTFQFESLKTGSFYLRVIMLGYEDFFSAPILLDKKSDVPFLEIDLISTALALDAVEVIAKKPFLEQKAGALVVNVENSITGQGGSLVDILKKVPGMIVTNNKVRLAGRSGVTILIDGKPTNYMDMESLLREMPADNIQRIEVVSQPDASYDAAGTGGVINIILKKNVLLGTNGSANVGIGFGRWAKYRAGFSINHRQGDLNLYGSVGASKRTSWEALSLNRLVQGERFIQRTDQPYLPYSGSVRAGLDWSVQENQTLGLSFNLRGSKNERTNANDTRIFDSNAQFFSNILTRNNLNRDWYQIATDAYYTYEIDTLGQKLELDFNYTNYDRDASTFVTTEVLNGEPLNFDNRRTTEPGKTYIYSGKLDYTLPINKAWRFKAGAKFSTTNIDSDLLSEFLQDGVWQNDVLQTNRFIYDEKLAASYINASYSSDKFEAQVGLRYEYTNAEGKSITLDSTVTLKLNRVFPSASLSIPISEKLGVAAAYSYRIERPRYSSLNPFVYYLDPFTFEVGNPFLRPELTHTGKLSLTYEKQPFFNLEYSRTNDVIMLVTEQDDETGATAGRDINLDHFDRYGGSFFFPLDFTKWLSGYGGFMLYYNRFSSDYLDGQFDQGVWSFTSFLQANIKLPKDWSAEINGWYQGKGLEGIMSYRPLYGISFGLEKKLMDGQATLQLSVDDLIYKYWRGNIDYQNMNIDILSEWETQVVSLRFTYKFGNRYLKKRKTRRAGSAEERQRANVKG